MIIWEPITKDTLFNIDKHYLVSCDGFFNIIIHNSEENVWKINTGYYYEYEQIELEKIKKEYHWYSELNLPQ
jgi:hypothetical protein